MCIYSFTRLSVRSDALDEICVIDTVSLLHSSPITELLTSLATAKVNAVEGFSIFPLTGNEAAYPGVNVDLSITDVFRSENVRSPTPWADVLRSQAPEINVPPDTRHSVWHRAAFPRTIRPSGNVENGYFPSHPADIFNDPADWGLILLWVKVVSEGFALADQYLLPDGKFFHLRKDFRFPYSDLPGGKDGLFIPESRRRFGFRGVIWDLRFFLSGQGHIRPYRPDLIDPQSRCDLNLAAMVDEAHFRNYPDIEFLVEMKNLGIHNRGHVWQSVLLCPPYKGLFDTDKYQFLVSKNMDKRAKVPPRFEGPFRAPPLLGCYCCPVNVAARASDGKLRVTRDFGAPRNLNHLGQVFVVPPRANTPGPLSLNAQLPMLDQIAFPDILMLSVPALMRCVAELASIRACFPKEKLPSTLFISKFKADYAAFYETLCRCAVCDNVQLQFSFAAGFEIDPRLIFEQTWDRYQPPP